jgi:hypothetical protein
MLKRLGDDQGLYSMEAAMLFNIFIHFSENLQFTSPNLFQYAVAIDPALRDMLLKQKTPPSRTSLKKSLLEVDRKLTSRCAGILEVVSHLKGQADIEYILSRDIIRPWVDIGIEFLHRSAKDFLLSMKDTLLDQDPTSAAKRQFQVLQAIILEDSYPPENYQPERNVAMSIMINAKPTLSNDQEVDLLKLTQEIYERNGWCEFYEVAARHGLHQPLVHLLESSPGDITPLRNYLLLCSMSAYTVRTNTTVSQLLGKGGDFKNSVALVPVLTKADSFLSLPMPLLGYFFTLSYSGVRSQRKLIIEMVELLLEAGADLEQKFLCPAVGVSHIASHEFTRKTRPCYAGYFLNSNNFDLLLEINCIEIILTQFVDRSYFTPAERLAMISRWGLDIERAHHKVILYFYKDTVYGAGDEDSDTLNQILDWPPPSRIHGKADGGDTGEEREKKRQAQFEKVREVLKGKEVDDVKKWLTDRGHVLLEDSDVAAISDQASVHEMAEIYERISKTAGKGR